MNNACRVFFLVPPKVQLLDITGPAHVFYEARQFESNIELHYVSLSKNTNIQSCADVFLGGLEYFQKYELDENDILLIPGVEADLLTDKLFEQSNQDFYRWLRKQADQRAKICAVCTGAYLLAQSMLLDNRRGTTHWKYIEDFEKRFPKVQTVDNRLFVSDNHIYTSAGVSSGIDLSLFLLEEIFGPELVAKVAKEVVIYLRRTADDPQLSIFLQNRNHINERIHTVQDYILRHLQDKITISKLAQIAHMSQRNLTRTFKKTLGMTIGSYIEHIRIEKASQWLSEGQKVEYVSKQCGFNSPNQLRALFLKHKGVLPSSLAR